MQASRKKPTERRDRAGKPLGRTSRDASKPEASFSLGDKSTPGESNRKYYSHPRRSSEMAIESERMPGAERPEGRGKGNRGLRGGNGGGGGLTKCQRVWKMVPQSRDTRPTWLRQYEVRLRTYVSILP